jgi:hypothetical protein
VKSSSDVVGAVLKELRLQAGGTEGGFRLAVAVGVNSLWGRTTLKKEDKSPVLIYSFTSLWIYEKKRFLLLPFLPLKFLCKDCLLD